MPIYEYLCPECGHHFEKLVKLDESPACPSCQCEKPQRKFSLSAGISTGRTRDKSLNKARKISGSIRKEQNQAQAEYERKHHEEHRDSD